MSKTSKSALSQITMSSVLAYMRRHTYLSVAIVSWGVMLLLAVLVLVPQMQQIIAETSDVTTQQALLQTVTSRVAFLTAINAGDMENNRVLLQTILPSQKPVMPLISSLEQLAQTGGVVLKNFELSPGSVATNSANPGSAAFKGSVAGVTSLPLKLEAQGGFAQMNTFFKSLDSLVPLVNVKTINFTQISSGGVSSVVTDAQYKATVELESLYFTAPNSQAGDATAALQPLSPADQTLISNLTKQVAAQPAVSQSVFTSTTVIPSGTTRTTLFSY